MWTYSCSYQKNYACTYIHTYIYFVSNQKQNTYTQILRNHESKFFISACLLNPEPVVCAYTIYYITYLWRRSICLSIYYTIYTNGMLRKTKDRHPYSTTFGYRLTENWNLVCLTTNAVAPPTRRICCALTLRWDVR